jgi:hypothetical protein
MSDLDQKNRCYMHEHGEFYPLKHLQNQNKDTHIFDN